MGVWFTLGVWFTSLFDNRCSQMVAIFKMFLNMGVCFITAVWVSALFFLCFCFVSFVKVFIVLPHQLAGITAELD
jgi:hypothetical protein